MALCVTSRHLSKKCGGIYMTLMCTCTQHAARTPRLLQRGRCAKWGGSARGRASAVVPPLPPLSASLALAAAPRPQPPAPSRRQNPPLGSCALCAARCRMYCVASMKRLAQFSTHDDSRPERYVPGDEMHLSQQTSVSVAIICCTCRWFGVR